MPSTRIPCALIAERATPRIAAFNPGASPPPLTTAKVFLLLIRFLSFPQSLEIVPERAAGAGDAHGRDAFLLECRSFRKNHARNPSRRFSDEIPQRSPALCVEGFHQRTSGRDSARDFF